jgi:hypothetical protein
VPHDPAQAESPAFGRGARQYRAQCDQILAGVSLSDAPRGRHGDDELPNVRVVVLHMIEETAAHSGHLEIARELLDGKTGLGLR